VLATGDRFNDSEDDYQLIRDELGAGLRDMEGAAIAHVCKKNGVRFRAVKCITNVAGKGSMTGQYEESKARCLTVLTEALGRYLRIA
jgi:nucleoside phosphorylase